jgi:ABC-type multidrug transport system fused ATPase/permease subunit
MRRGTFSVGDFALFATYLIQVADFMGFVGYLIGSYQQSRVSFRRMVALMRGAPPLELVAPPPVRGAARPVPCAAPPLQEIKVLGLTCTHPGGRGLRRATFTLRREAITAVTGHMGSGKTTLLRAVLGLLPAEEGELLWNGRPIADPAAFLVPPRAAYVPQVPALLSGTIRDNVQMGLAAGEEEMEQAASVAMLSEDIASFPQGWETQIGSGGVRLSGGQAQRVAIARALLRDPELLVLDDVSSALDEETERRLVTALLARAGTCLVATNSTRLLRAAQEVLWLEDGRIAARGQYASLNRRCR